MECFGEPHVVDGERKRRVLLPQSSVLECTAQQHIIRQGPLGPSVGTERGPLATDLVQKMPPGPHMFSENGGRLR